MSNFYQEQTFQTPKVQTFQPNGSFQTAGNTAYMPGCPPGLEYLALLDQLLVRQKVELFEAITNIETENKFVIQNKAGQNCYHPYEDSNICMRLCCGPNRGFLMHIADNSGNEVIRLTRPFKCCAGCCWCAGVDPCCSHEIIVEAPPGTMIGKVCQAGSCWAPAYTIKDAHNNVVFKVNGPCCPVSGVCCMCDFVFDIKTAKTPSHIIGNVTKTYGGVAKECCTDATNFTVNFPMDLDVKMKACILSMTFLIDIMFFENNN